MSESQLSADKIQKPIVAANRVPKSKEEKKPEKMVFIEAIGDVQVENEIYGAGSILEVPESLAKDLCKPIKKHFAFTGDRHESEHTHHMVTRAKMHTTV